MWAEVAERLADMWGRQIRYGMPPDDPERPFGDQMTRRGFVDLWIEGTSQVIANFEIGAQGIEEADRLVDEAGAENSESAVPAHLFEELEKSKRQSAEQYETLSTMLDEVQRAFVELGRTGR